MEGRTDIRKQNEERLDMFADMLEPFSVIVTSPDVQEYARKGNTLQTARAAIKNHKAEVIALLAAYSQTPPDEYIVPRPLTMAVKMVELFNDPDVKELFTLQDQKDAAARSGTATANTQGGAV